MEEVLSVYQRPVVPEVPLVCLDEFCKQLLSEKRTPLPARPGQTERYDYEYSREGCASGFMLAMPHLGKREVYLGPEGRRTSKDFAHCLEYLATTVLPDAQKIVLVMDNLNTHKSASLYEAFPPQKALELWQRFEVHYTPKHGSWLNMAEIEIGLLARRCLNRRIGSFETLHREVSAYIQTKNKESNPIRWHFSTHDARIKLASLYPSQIS